MLYNDSVPDHYCQKDTLQLARQFRPLFEWILSNSGQPSSLLRNQYDGLTLPFNHYLFFGVDGINLEHLWSQQVG